MTKKYSPEKLKRMEDLRRRTIERLNRMAARSTKQDEIRARIYEAWGEGRDAGKPLPMDERMPEPPEPVTDLFF